MLVFSCSPHAGGVTDSLAEAVCAGARAAGAAPGLIKLREFQFSGCSGCQLCSRNLPCPLPHDDSEILFDLLAHADRAVFVSPIYFYALPGQFKLLIDRSQRFWPGSGLRRDRLAGIALAAGRARGEKLFSGARLTLKWFLKPFGYAIIADACFRGTDFAPPDPGQAYELGAKIAGGAV